MNKSISNFMGMALTAIVIAFCLFGVGYTMVKNETNDYKSDVEGVTHPTATATTSSN
ncbi:hypothetical protein LCY76_22815 [Fictibacillus sp. KIGAM418]|uniref:YtzI protein n=1 Tax=Fictibacillus marinisediminis TaxID=2878389 RepID=A0A9X2BJ90_9BACL|nr:hypothetical protein [Fictibacillus marinisediminis]MCK6259408.1 hypothetical protein [Fictibacillus marinisediminis]